MSKSVYKSVSSHHLPSLGLVTSRQASCTREEVAVSFAHFLAHPLLVSYGCDHSRAADLGG